MDLRELLTGPGLALEPPEGLEGAVRSRARRVRLRRRAVGAVLAVVGLVGAVTVLPGPGTRTSGQLAAEDPDHGVTSATSEVVVLERLNGAAVLAWFEDDELCTAAVRVKRGRTCLPGVDPQTRTLFPGVLRADDDSVRVDDRRLAAGLVRADVAEVRLLLRGAPPVPAAVSRGRGFPLAVFHVEVPRGSVATGLEGFAADGSPLGTRTLLP